VPVPFTLFVEVVGRKSKHHGDAEDYCHCWSDRYPGVNELKGPSSNADNVQGKSIAETFLEMPGWHVRGISRTPSSEAAQTLAAQGVEVIKGDLGDMASLVPAFQGATVIYANTDFFQPFRAAIASPEIAGGRNPRQYAHDVEFEHGMNIAEAAASPGSIKSLTHFLYSTLCNPTKTSKGKYTQIFHNNVKAKVTRTIEDRFPELFQRMSTVHIGHYVTNWHAFPPARPRKQADGSFFIERTFSPDMKLPFIYTHRDTGPFVKALVGVAPGKHINAFSEEMTFPQFTEIFAKELGVRASYRQVSEEEHFAGVPDALKEELLETFRFAEEFGLTGAKGDFLTAQEVSAMFKATYDLF
jgi:hypothetical protein